MTSILRGTASVALVAIAVIAVDQWVLGITRGGGVSWTVIAEGAVTGGVLGGVWLLGRERGAALAALGGLVVALAAGWIALDSPLGHLPRSSLAWPSAVLLGVVLLTTSAGQDRDVQARAEPRDRTDV